MKRNKQVLWAMTDLGDDLIDTAEQIRFAKPLWRQLLPLAACLAAFLGLWQFGKEMKPIETEPASPEVSVVNKENFSGELFARGETAHILDISNEGPRMIAVDKNGAVVVEAERLDFITDQETGERLAILAATVWGGDSDWKSAERIVYDLYGRKLCRLNARGIQCVGDVAAVTYHTGNVSLYHRDGTLIEDNLTWAVAYSDCMAVGYGEKWEQRYYSPEGTLLVDTVRDGLNRFETYGGKRTLFYRHCDQQIGLVDLYGNWIVEPMYAAVDFVNETCVRAEDSVGNWMLVSLETGEVLYRLDSEQRFVEPHGDFLFCMGEAGSWWEDWNGTVIVPAAPQAQAVDEEDDGNPELFFVQDLQGETVYYGTDGTERLRVYGLPDLVTLSVRTAVGIRDTGLRLIDLNTGEERGGFAKTYVKVNRVYACGEDREQLSGCFYAWYRDENGMEYADLMDESGTILLEQLLETREGAAPYIGGGAFRVEGGFRHIDGAWLYRE